MKTYSDNSPEAIARVLAMTMITDAKLDDRELDEREWFEADREDEYVQFLHRAC